MNDPGGPRVRYEAFGGPGEGNEPLVEGVPYRGRDGYLFRDAEGAAWWVLFSVPHRGESGGPGSGVGGQTLVRGDLVACARVEEEGRMGVRVLARDVSREEADRAFLVSRPGSLEEAVVLAAALQAAGQGR